MTDRIAALLAEHPVFDGHNDIAWALRTQANYDLAQRDIALPQPALHTDIPRLRAGGVGAQFFSVYVPGDMPGSSAVTATLEQIDCVYKIAARYPETFALARTATETKSIMAQGKIAALMGAEGGHSIDNSLPTLRMLRKLGVAYMTLTHNHNTDWADSATDVALSHGLNDFGRDVVREMNRIGMIVDISHVAATTMRAAIQTSTAPVIFSHSSCRALCDHVRDAPDDVLAALAKNDGVIMVTFVPAFVSQECADHGAAEKAEIERLGLVEESIFALDVPGQDPNALAQLNAWKLANPAPKATLSQVADHVEHAREAAGVANIGLGGDFDGVSELPEGLQDVSTYPALLSELADRGWSDSELAGLTSQNALRVLQAAEEIADDGFGA
ncbi:membrane dipeptidase [Nakamurella antarctica]|uniref:Membrane dipeptidase n=1 Tax=Nakamurella antarctica TaxID=1902245 RepID=A0A3G8ZNV2_9ACTN|nr:dipeptidase [Nakamurella antarctica]AZI58933.1 membrane dipeptidase [Nakamurella antarctica]